MRWPFIFVLIISIHLVIKADQLPEKIMTAIKAYITRALRKTGYNRLSFWTRHGSTRFLFTDDKIKKAVHYVLYEQGEPMSVYSE